SPTKVSGGSTAQFVVRTTKINTVSDVNINYVITGTAVAGEDYISAAPSGTITIPVGATSAQLTINTVASPSSVGRVATLRLQSGIGYKVSTPSRSSVMVTAGPSAAPSPTPTSTPTPTPTPTPTLQQEIWIAIRNDGVAGSGTQADPFNCSTPEKFDTLLYSYRTISNLGIHL